MAVTWTFSNVVKRQVFMPENVPGEKTYDCTATITADGSATYATGGDDADITASSVFNVSADGTLDFIDFELAVDADPATAAWLPSYDRTNNHLQLMVGDSSADGIVELAATTDVSDLVVRVRARLRDSQ